MTSPSELVTLSMQDGIADVRLNRPEKLNAVSRAMIEAIAAMLAKLETMPGLRCVVFSGEGRGFCAGIDLTSLASNSIAKDLITRTHGPANLPQHIVWGWRQLPVPVIAAVHGMAFGAGFQLMLGADIRIAAPEAQLSIMELRWGLVPDMAGMPLLRGLVRDDVARELIYTARKFPAQEGASLGVITRVAENPLAEAMVLAKTIARQSPPAIRAAKRLLNFCDDPEALLQAEAREQQALAVSPEHAETLAAARENRPPRFADPK